MLEENLITLNGFLGPLQYFQMIKLQNELIKLREIQYVGDFIKDWRQRSKMLPPNVKMAPDLEPNSMYLWVSLLCILEDI